MKKQVLLSTGLVLGNGTNYYTDLAPRFGKILHASFMRSLDSILSFPKLGYYREKHANPVSYFHVSVKESKRVQKLIERILRAAGPDPSQGHSKL